MSKIKNVINNLKELQNIPYDDIQNEIIITFGDYQENDKTEVIVNELASGKIYQAYINSKNSKLIIIRTETSKNSPSEVDLLNVIDVYIEQ